MTSPVSGTFKIVGSPHWTSGPLALVPATLHERWHTSFAAPEGKALAKVKRISLAKSMDAPGVFFPFGEAGCFVDKSVIVLVQAKDAEGHRAVPALPILKAAKQVDVDPAAWKEVSRFTPAGPHVLSDAVARDPRTGMRERKKRVAVKLAGGEYVIEQIKNVVHTVKAEPNKRAVAITYTFTRLRPANLIVKTKAATKAQPGPSELVATSAVIKAARKLRFVDNDQTCSLVMPVKALRVWGGLGGDGRDYWRACAVKSVGTIDVEGHQALVIGMDSGMTFWPVGDGGLIVLWVGGDSAAGVVTSALQMPAKGWKAMKTRWKVTDGKLALIGAPTVGTKAGRTARVDFTLARGTYRVEWAWQSADVRVGKKLEPTQVMVVRITR